MGWVFRPKPTRLGSVVSSLSGSGEEPRPKTVLMHFQLERPHLMEQLHKFGIFFCDTKNRKFNKPELDLRERRDLHSWVRSRATTINGFDAF